jgi:beta-galactosidase
LQLFANKTELTKRVTIMKPLLILSHLFVLFAFTAQSQQQREKIKIDKDWRFHFGHAANAEKDFHYSIANSFAKTGASKGTPVDPSFADTSWRKLDLPHDWAVELPFVYKDNFDLMSHGYKPVGGLFPETSIGWYRKKIFIPASDSGRRIALEFDGVFRDAQFWLNGFYMGRNESGYMGVHYDVTDFVKFNGDNVITVRVDATQYEGWFYEGAGIYRHVWLHKYQNVHIAPDGIFAFANIAGNKANITIESALGNHHNYPANATVSAYLTHRNGERVAAAKDISLKIDATGNAMAKQIISVTNPKLWSPDDPYLYRLVVEVKDGGKVLDRQEMRYGIRTIEVKPNGVFVNGKHTKLLGVNCHQDHAGVGSALPDYLQYYRISLLKRLGVNAYRASHNPPTPELLDACDSLGMLVMDETRLLNTGPEYMDQLENW